MPSRIPSIALRMPWAMFLNASSLFVHVVTGRRSIGSPWTRKNGAPTQSTGRRGTGITVASFVMAIKSPLGFNVVVVLRGEKRRTDQKQDDLGFFQVLVELSLPLLACPDPSVMPTYDIALPLQESQMLLKLVSQSLILVRVRVEQADRSGWLLGV